MEDLGKTMRFKYQSFIELIPECPPRHRAKGSLIAYRFVSEDVDNPRNFCPSYIRNPKRQNAKQETATLCSGFGLSFYDTLSNARKSYNYFLKLGKHIQKALGTHIACGKIGEEDGVITEKSSSGHFDLHQYDHVDFSGRFVIEDKAI